MRCGMRPTVIAWCCSSILPGPSGNPGSGSTNGFSASGPSPRSCAKPAKNKKPGRKNSTKNEILTPVTMNGQKIVHYETDRLTRGYIGLQNHDHHAVVKFRPITHTDSHRFRPSSTLLKV